MTGERMDADRLRDEFDRAFALPFAARPGPGEMLLSIDVAGDPYAVRLNDLAFLDRGAAPAFLATGTPGFLGLAGRRGELLPVWDLAVLLGYPAASGKPAWVIGCAQRPRWAAAFGGFGGLARAPEGGLEPVDGGGPAGRFTCGVLRIAGVCRPVLDLSLISQAIRDGSRR